MKDLENICDKKVELLVPAGDLKKLKYAVFYGADAVYIGGENFSLRARANNFSSRDMKEAVNFCHENNRKLYVAVNAFIRNNEIENLEKYLKFLDLIKVDGVIVSDIGVIFLIKKLNLDLKIHLSTQANTTNFLSARFWEELGIKRIVLARELFVDEISEIVKQNKNIDFEIFIHGAMCISYSGRCFLSVYMINRDANRGDCAHPCRWKYRIKSAELEEEKRDGELMKYEEDEKGAYIFNSKDMCQILRIKELIETGVRSFKIEGRMKSLYYVISITRLYRRAIDLYYKNPSIYEEEKNNIFDEILKLNNRGYTEGFYFGEPKGIDYNYKNNSVKVNHYFLAEILEILDNFKIKVLVKNTFSVGEKIEILTPFIYEENFVKIKSIY